MASLKEVKGRISSINGTLKIRGHRKHASLRTKTTSHAYQFFKFGAECRVAFHCET